MNRRDVILGSAAALFVPPLPYSRDWRDDCMRWRGKLLTGRYAHWCPDWDYLPIDETTVEWPTCTCRWT